MSASTQIILLERVEKLGEMGEIVSVKPGFARNYLLPQKKALRASKENVAYFEAQKKALEKANEESRKEAEKLAKKINGIRVPMIRQASEGGQLFGSVNSRDIALAVSQESKETITRNQVELNQNIKTIGLIPVELRLHPEVKVEITVNIARSAEEAKIQAETGRALLADNAREEPQEPSKEDALTDGEEGVEEGTPEDAAMQEADDGVDSVKE